MSEFLQQAQPILTLLQWVVAIAAAVFMLYMRSVFVTVKDANAKAAADAKTIESLSHRLTNAEGRLDRMSDRMGSSPTAKDVHELSIAIERLTGQLGIASERMSGMEDLQKVFKHQVDRIEDFLAKTR